MAQFINYSIQLSSTVVLARLLKPEDFGLVGMVFCFFLFFKMVRNFGLIDAIIQEETISHEKINSLFWTTAFFSGGLTALFMAIAPLIAWFYHKPELVPIAVGLSFVFLLGGLSTQHVGLLKREMQFYKTTANEIIASALSISLAIYLAFADFGYWALVARNVSAELFLVVGAWVLCSWRPGRPAYTAETKKMLGFGFNMITSYFTSYFSQNMDKILIGWRYGASPLAFYDRSYQLFMSPAQQISYPLVHVATATLSRLKHDPPRLRQYFLNALSLLAFVGMPLSAMLSITGRDVIMLILGPQWEPAIPIFIIFSLGIGMQIIYGAHSWLHISLGRADRLRAWGMFSSVFIVAGFSVGMLFSARGVAVSYIVSLYLLLLPSLWFAGRPLQLSIRAITAAIWKYFAAALLAGLFSWFALNSWRPAAELFSLLHSFLRVVLSCFLCGLLYLVFIVLLYGSFRPIREFFNYIKIMRPDKTTQQAPPAYPVESLAGRQE